MAQEPARATTVSLDSFPAEVLGLILEASTPPGLLVPRRGSPPLLFTEVSQRWRSIALSSPSLWSRLSVNIKFNSDNLKTPIAHSETEAKMKQKGLVIRRWLTNAGNSKVSIRISITDYKMDGVSVYLRNRVFLPSLDKICANRYTSKWKHLNLADVSEPYSSRLFSIPVEDLQSLQSFTFTNSLSSTPNSDGTRSLAESGIIKAENLTKLDTNSPDKGDILQQLPLANWGGLTDLRIQGTRRIKAVSSINMHSVLSLCCGNLRSLGLEVGYGRSHQTFLPLTFPHLHSLNVYEKATDSEDPPHLQAFMSSLITPALVSLIWDTACDPRFGSSSLLAFAKANNGALPRLSKVSTDYCYMWPDEFDEFLGIIGGPGSAVKELSLLGSSVCYRDMGDGPPPFAIFWSRVLESLTPGLDLEVQGQTTKQFLFPALEKLHCNLIREDEFNDQDLMAFIRGRLIASENSKDSTIPSSVTVARPRSICVDFISQKSVDIWEELKGLNAHDLNIAVTYDNERGWADI
ncbi:hypothetical protein FA15DRAFT_674558 [Coprinopsis marcescibilis]|uniref:F-box domain-containing protein n=1 Tax=Coprinopsis marcescibilis TaxID=230819 RepID=A0A5C3KHQ8_COPMA|nr:hypothetical protein FA15DRAFT_674558 [Coprinopsis marcescibilis]